MAFVLLRAIGEHGLNYYLQAIISTCVFFSLVFCRRHHWKLPYAPDQAIFVRGRIIVLHVHNKASPPLPSVAKNPIISLRALKEKGEWSQRCSDVALFSLGATEHPVSLGFPHKVNSTRSVKIIHHILVKNEKKWPTVPIVTVARRIGKD